MLGAAASPASLPGRRGVTIVMSDRKVSSGETGPSPATPHSYSSPPLSSPPLAPEVSYNVPSSPVMKIKHFAELSSLMGRCVWLEGNDMEYG